MLTQGFDTYTQGVDSAEQVLTALMLSPWDLLVIDVALSRTITGDVIGLAITLRPEMPILILATQPDRNYARRMFQLGVKGYVSKSADVGEFNKALEALLQHQRYISMDILRRAPSLPAGPVSECSIQELLSDREFQVMHALLSGKSVSQISTDLSLSVKSISTYRTRILSKVGVSNNMHLMRFAIQHGLV